MVPRSEECVVKTAAPGYQPGRRVLEAARRRPDDTALVVADESWSYRELLGAARSLADRLAPARFGDPQPTTAILAHRHASSYVGMLAARLAGHAMLPIVAAHPPARSAELLQRANASQIVCGERGDASLAALLECQRDATAKSGGNAFVVRCPDDKRAWQPSMSGSGDVDDWQPAHLATLEDVAYVLFTSGSTGKPKGVPVGNAQFESYLQAVRELLGIAPGDRLSQNSDMCFDAAMHDLFACWEAGGTLVVPSVADQRRPAAYIHDHRLTHWFSVPSVGRQMELQGDLKPGAFPSLRVSVFAGEALYQALAKTWAEAAPNSSVENWYGLTEAAVVCCRHVVDTGVDGFGTVPIGRAFPRMEALLLDERLEPCPANEVGEVFLVGPQVASGYLDDPEETRKRFVTLPDGRLAYRTGDRASHCDDGLTFLGRADSQVNLLGRRIELGEVEAAVVRATQGRNAVALAWPPAPAPPATILAVVEAGDEDGFDPAELRRRLASQLVPSMVPSRIYATSKLPRNANGKVDREAVASWLAAEMERAPSAPSQLKGRSSRATDLVMEAVLEQAPYLKPSDILNARNLMDAGLDSLGFVGFTAALEEGLGLALDQQTIVELAEMPFLRIVDELKWPHGGGVLRRLRWKCGDLRGAAVESLRRLTGKPRIVRTAAAGRAAQFIQRFPAYVHDKGVPDVLVVGWSGAFRAFSPREFEAEAAALGRRARAVNAALPGVHVADMRRLCAFVKACYGPPYGPSCPSPVEKTAGRVGPVIVFELELVHLSSKPPPKRIRLDRDMLSGNVVVAALAADMRENGWHVDTAGARNAPQEATARSKPLWMLRQERYIVDVWRGAVPLNPAAMDAWLGAASELQSAAGRLVGLLPPMSPDRRPEGKDGLHASGVMREVERRLNIQMLSWRDFDLAETDFLNIAHLHPGEGRAKFSRQLARLLYGAVPAPAACGQHASTGQ